VCIEFQKEWARLPKVKPYQELQIKNENLKEMKTQVINELEKTRKEKVEVSQILKTSCVKTAELFLLSQKTQALLLKNK